MANKNMKFLKTVNRAPTDKQLDALYYECVYWRDGGMCRYTKEIHGAELTRDDAVLQVHHILKKSTQRLRWNLDNGILLSKGIHYGTAHSQKRIQENQFMEWALDRLPRSRRDKLELIERLRPSGGVDRFALKLFLEKKLKEYKEAYDA